MTNEQMRQRIAELEEGLRPFADLAVTVDGCADYAVVHVQAHVVRRAASLLSAAQPASEPDADVVERVWRAAVTGCLNIAIDEQNRSNDDDADMRVLDAQEEIIRRLRGQLEMSESDRAALSAMRPAIDREKLREIRRAYDAWRAADTLCGLLADPEDEGSPSERQEAAAEAAWAWDQAASKFMWNADALLAMFGGEDD